MFRRGLLLLSILLTQPLVVRAQEGPIFPSRLDLEKKWENFQSKDITPASVAAILKEDPSGGQLVRWGEGRWTSIWAGVQRKLAADPKLSAALREEHDRNALALVEQSAGDLNRLMVLARRFPFAHSVHRALTEAGLHALYRGQAQLARGCFQDVLTCSNDAALRSQAQVGLWLAAAHDPGAGVLDTAFAGIDPASLYPWMGKKLSAAEIHDRLKSKPAPDPTPLKDLDRVVLEIPASKAWVFIQPGAYDDGVLVGGPCTLSWYDVGKPKPTWTKEHPFAVSEALWGGLVAGPFQPPVVDGRIFTRWGIDTIQAKAPARDYNLLANVAALDQRTGKVLWSTSGIPLLAELCPVNDPAVSDGRVYFLAVSRTREFTPVYLVCLDAAQGGVLWVRELVTNHTTLMNVFRPGKTNPHVDLAHFGVPVTVSGGRVYCLTNMGVAVCCDARDGLILWARTYAQDMAAGVLARPGSAPLPAGKRIVFLPRDGTVVFAVDPATGDLGWRRADATLQMLGSEGDMVLLGASRKIYALKLDDGDVHWTKDLPDAADGRAILSGRAIYVGTQGKLYRLDARTGAIVEEINSGKLGELGGMVLRGKVLYLT